MGVYEYFGTSRQIGHFYQHGSVAQNAGGWHTVIFGPVFEKGQFVLYYGVSQTIGTKVVISALRMSALYMCFNGTGIMVSPP